MNEIKDIIDGFLSDNHRLRSELERTKKALQVYNSALTKACDILEVADDSNRDSNWWKESLLDGAGLDWLLSGVEVERLFRKEETNND